MPHLNRALRMQPDPNNNSGQKRTQAPYVHPSPQHITTPTLFHQSHQSDPPSFVPPTLTTVNYYANTHQECAPLTGSYSHHPPSHNSSYHHHHTSALQSLRSAHPFSAVEWPEAGSTVQPQFQMDSTGGRYGEGVAFWHSFLNESNILPPSGSGGPSEPIASGSGEPIQYVLLAVSA